MDELVRVKNLGDSPFEGHHLGERTIIPAGEEAPWIKREAAILWFGDPASVDHYEGSDLKDDRTKECQRLDTRYGIFAVHRSELGVLEPKTRENAWPKVKVMSMDGTEIRMVVHDPEGVGVTPVAQTKEDRGLLLETIDDLKRRVEAYEAKAAVSAQLPADGEADVAQDTPTGRSRGRAS